MKILVALSGASSVELGFYLLNALEKYTRSNDELFAILSKNARLSLCAENLILQGALREFKGENSSLHNDKLAKSKVKQFTQSKSKGDTRCETTIDLQGKKNKLKAQNLSQNDEFISICKQNFALHKTHFFDDENLAASVASGSFGINATIIAPCSLNTLAKIRQGISDTLISRSAAVALKERKKLILAVREMPFSTLVLKQMTKLSKMGVIIAPPVFASYSNATSLNDLRKFIIGKWLDLLEIKHDLYQKWQNP
ncbi:UbiX family flavin prenyltransferase [Campylobacter troglodytis]|uniref:UbiX family flavin prenyltransferase n=1 Tax=Campylobacter troglodytis TaxID=654363 RepID=UPI00115766D7|nr:UbiX family flavin prenyltransferase [Campylobacter troglodytis]